MIIKFSNKDLETKLKSIRSKEELLNIEEVIKYLTDIYYLEQPYTLDIIRRRLSSNLYNQKKSYTYKLKLKSIYILIQEFINKTKIVKF